MYIALPRGITMTIHKILDMVVDWVAGDSKYKTRLELGQSSGTLTDLRFMVPAWIENIQTLWFGENGTEGAYNGSDGAKITAYLSAGNVTDLVFFDPQNTGGKTLSELASVAGLWETSGTRTSLISSQPIDLANELNMAGQIIDNVPRINANGTGGIVIYDSTDAMRAGLGATSYALQCFNAGIDMGDHDINNINDIKGNQAVGADVDFYGSNAAGGALVNFMGWDSATETVKVNKPMAMGGNDITGVDEIKGTNNQDIYIKPQGTGILYLG
jgi:hypothetical protein